MRVPVFNLDLWDSFLGSFPLIFEMGIRPFLTSSDGAELPAREGFAPSKDFFTLMEALIMLNYKSLNAVTLVGRIGSLDMRSSASGSKFLTCSVVTESSVKENGAWTHKAVWHNVTVFGNAEKMIEKLEKGCLVMVVGSLDYRKTEKGMFCNIVADQFQILSSSSKEAQQPQSRSQTQRKAPVPAQTRPQTSSEDEELF